MVSRSASEVKHGRGRPPGTLPGSIGMPSAPRRDLPDGVLEGGGRHVMALNDRKAQSGRCEDEPEGPGGGGVASQGDRSADLVRRILSGHPPSVTQARLAMRRAGTLTARIRRRQRLRSHPRHHDRCTRPRSTRTRSPAQQPGPPRRHLPQTQPRGHRRSRNTNRHPPASHRTRLPNSPRPQRHLSTPAPEIPGSADRSSEHQLELE
jgi:hypothetical protein